MSAQEKLRARSRRLPPFGREIKAMVDARLRPVQFGGSVVVSLDWRLGTSWPRIVLPPDVDPHEFDLSFLRGLSLLVVYRPGHPAEHLAAALDAIHAAGPHEVAPIALPHLVDE